MQSELYYVPSPCQKELAWLCPLACRYGGTSQSTVKSEAEVCQEALQKALQYPGRG